jgi:uncharacterized protein YkwD
MRRFLMLRNSRLILALGLVLGGFGLSPQQSEGQSLYVEDGEPTALEEEIRWLLNRARHSRSKENARRGSSYGDIPAKSAPLAPNARLIRAARNHCEDMARRNRFQHATVPGSFFYNPATHPNSWDRLTAEGYVWNMAGENIAAGYPTAASVYVGWWHSAGHRHNMFDPNYREIGNGHYFRAASEYLDYFGMSLGRSGGNRFFTDTLFQDVNGNRTYNQGEGRGGVRVELIIGGVKHSVQDVSTAVGSFAIPLGDIPVDAIVRVMLTNTTAAPLVITLPRVQDPLEMLAIGPGESRPWGHFVRAQLEENYGLRDALAPVDYLVFNPLSAVHPAEGGSGFDVAVDSNVSWTASSSVPWLRITSGESGTEAGTITYALDPHSFGDPRSAVITVTGDQQLVRTFQITQTGLPTLLSLAQTEVTVLDTGSGAIPLPVTANVTWRAQETAHWLRLNEPTGATGDGQLTLVVAPNAGSVAREATVTITGGGQSRQVIVRQAAGAVRRLGEVLTLDLAEGSGSVKKVVGLPSGWVWDKITGQVSGRATRGGTYFVKVDVQVPGGAIEKRTLTFIVSPLPASAVGSFEMRLAREAGLGNGLGGELRMTVTASGAVSGSLSLAGRTDAWRGLLYHADGQNPEVISQITRRGDTAVSLRIELKPDHRAVGEARPNPAGDPVMLTGWRRVWAAKLAEVPTALKGQMNVLFDLKPDWQGQPSLPQGTGYSVLKVGSDGRVSWVGRLAEGSAIVRSGWLGPNGETALWQPLYAAKGSVLAAGISAPDGTYTGEADWVKRGPTSSRDRVYPLGFGLELPGPIGLTTVGERWQPPAPGQTLLELLSLPEVLHHLHLKFLSGVMEDTTSTRPDGPLTLTRSNRFLLAAPGTLANPSRLIVRLAATTGRVTGEFTLVDPAISPEVRPLKRRVLFDGLLLPKRLVAAGYFIAPKRSNPAPLAEIVSGRFGIQAVGGTP